jgi:hypothetical protein
MKRRLRVIAEAARDGTVEKLLSVPVLRPGTQLLRDWKGETHRVTVLADGFEWRGTRHRSLSAVAKAITGTNWNGYAFFGVKRRGMVKAKPIEGRRAQP